MCACGCGQPTSLARQTDKVKGWVQGQPIRFVRGHHTRLPRPKENPMNRLGRWIDRDSSECWIWTGAINLGGYGKTQINGRTCGAHRVVYELHVGPIAAGLTLDHLCRVRRCVNPAHLEPVSMRENLHRGNTVNAANAVKVTCKRGHPFDSENTYTFGRAYRQCRECARMHARNYQARRRLMKRETA